MAPAPDHRRDLDTVLLVSFTTIQDTAPSRVESLRSASVGRGSPHCTQLSPLRKAIFRAVSFLVHPRFDTFRTSHSRASAYGSLHESPSSVSTVLVPHRSVPSRQAHGWPLWCDIVRGGRPLCSYAVARRWHPIQGPMAHALSTVFDSSGPSLKHGGRCAHRTRGYHHQLHDRSTSSSLCSG